jgi:hypothetical protein
MRPKPVSKETLYSVKRDLVTDLVIRFGSWATGPCVALPLWYRETLPLLYY